MGERQSRERPHQDVRARTFERSGTRSEESRNRAYRTVLAAWRKHIQRAADFRSLVVGHHTRTCFEIATVVKTLLSPPALYPELFYNKR